MSVALASFVFLLAAVCAWAVVWFGRRADEPEGKLRALAVMFLGLGVVGGVFVYRTDREMRRETLFETVLELGGTGAGLHSRELSVPVEHPGVELTLRVTPIPAAVVSAQDVVLVGVEWRDEHGEVLLVAEGEAGLTSSSGRGVMRRRVWDSLVWRVTPRDVGVSRLRLRFEGPGIERVLVRVEDPLKVDGVRAPGY